MGSGNAVPQSAQITRAGTPFNFVRKDPLAEVASQKLEAANKPEVLQPLVTPKFTTPAATSTKPTLQDFISEAQKLGTSQFQAQADILGQNNEQLVKDLSRGLYSQNIGASSGVGQQVLQNVAKERTNQLAPYAQQTATQTALKALEYKQQESQQDQARQDNAFNMILSGQLDKSQFTPQDWAKYGITDPTAIKTIQDMDVAAQMKASGLDPNNPADQENYRTSLRGAAKNNIKKEIYSWYAAANDGQVPTPDEVNMMMAFYGQGTGALTNEELTALTNQYNSKSWNDKMERARQKAKAERGDKGSSVAGTLCYSKGLITKEQFLSVVRWRKIQKETFMGNKLWTGYQKAFGWLCNIGYTNNIVLKLIKRFVNDPIYAKSQLDSNGVKTSLSNKILWKGIVVTSFIVYAINKRSCDARAKFLEGNMDVFRYYRKLINKTELFKKLAV
jgi:hypothetical protein